MNVQLKPYIIQATYMWMIDSGLTPVLSFYSMNNSSVPSKFRSNNMNLDISRAGAVNLCFMQKSLSFECILDEEVYSILVPYQDIFSIYSRENKENGFSFDVNTDYSHLKIVH